MSPVCPERYVVGFLFHRNSIDVALIRKNRPEWQAGKLNGPGGKVEGTEAPRRAMRREFLEECGVDIEDWRGFAVIKGKEPAGDPNYGGTYEVYFYTAICDHEVARQVRTMTDEEVLWVHAPSISSRKDVLPQLRWLIPLAQHSPDLYVTAEDQQC